MIDKDYFIGFDIGTNSVGYAVTDTNYNIIRLKGKRAWGVRLFDEAKTAVDRRAKRTGRRRLDRRKLKLKWLQEIFEPEINKIDSKFLVRLKYSNLWQEDKLKMDASLLTKDSLFYGKVNGKIYTDKDYFNEYPTIYHLRKELTQIPAKDARFLYLALHNIIKRRGHFLYEGVYSQNIDFLKLYNELIMYSKSINEEILIFSLNENLSISDKEILSYLKICSVRDRKQRFYEIMGAHDKTSKKFVDIILEGKGNIKDIFILDEETETIKFSFDDVNFESEVYDELTKVLSDEQLILIDKLKEINSVLNLKKILGENNYICEAMVDGFNEHKSQLKMFKQFVKKYYPSKYFDVFRNPLSSEKDKFSFVNYPYYIGLSNFGGNGKFKNIGSSVTLTKSKGLKEDFYKFIMGILNSPPETNENIDEYESKKAEIIELIENNNFLNRQRTKANAVFPNKLYEKEVRKILDVNVSKFDFLDFVDDTGLTNYDKIIKILTFKVPYFVGPIGNGKENETTHSWSHRTNNLPIYPWTIDKIVNFDVSEEAFIKKMINKCTYLSDYYVLPKYSLLYSKFRILNELNKLKINGNSISIELKQLIFNKLFKNLKKVTLKNLKEFLLCEGKFSNDEIKDIEISGIDKDFANDYSSYYQMKNIFGEEFIDRNLGVVENIIKYITIINDKNRLEKRLEREYGNIISTENIKKLKALNFSDWGRLSEDFIAKLFFINVNTGEKTTIIDELWNTNQNLQEILFNSTYTLNDVLETQVQKSIQDLTYENVQELYCSPSVKRGVWQTICMLKEIIKLAGKEPEKVFVEVTRHDEKKGEEGRKLSRKNNLLKIYDSKDFKLIVNEIDFDLSKLNDELNSKNDSELRSEKLYLYFLQLGRCAYSGEPINILDIYKDNLYDVDHIIPQSILKDDSITNKVLVKQVYNKNKSDTYPISSRFDWVKKQDSFWKILVKLNLMNKEKYSRLVRKDELTEEEIGGFVARQLVQTNQTVKEVIDLLKGTLRDPQSVVYSKAKFVTEFRKEMEIFKSREVNDYHHAKDAYLNIVVGNILHNRFTNDPRNFYKNKFNLETTRNIKNLFYKTVFNYRNGEVVWNGVSDIIKIKEIVNRNDCMVSRMSYSNMNGAFYDETIYKSLKNNKNTKAKISLKGNDKNPLNDFEKYGGYNNMSSAYFMVVESEDKKGNLIKTIETVPIYAVRKFRNCSDFDEKILDYVVKKNGLINAKVLMKKINIKSTLKINQGEYLLAGKTENRYILHNANEWHISSSDVKYIKAIEKYIDMKLQNKIDNLKEIDEKVILSPKASDKNTEIALSKIENMKLYELLISQFEKDIYKGLALENIGQKLKEKQEIFQSLSVFHQAELIYNVIKRLSTGATLADLKLIGDSSNVGKIAISKNITNINVYLIERSFTGLIEKCIKL